jgi:riboflavin kinase/FMN adenylyltransferase
MKLLRRVCVSATGSNRNRECVATIGGFDGIHIGHQALIARTCADAHQLGLASMLLSFEPLPMEFLHAEDPPARLTNFRERWRLLERTGLDQVCLLAFDARLRAASAAQFMSMLRALRVRRVIVGHDFRFGRGGEADAEWCQAHAVEFGFEVHIVAPIMQNDLRVGSRRVREALATGALDAAARALGRRYAMRGRVLRGQQLGRTLGFPTANIAPRRRRLPLSGIFAIRVNTPGLARHDWPGVASLGTRPTVDGVVPLLESHLFDFEGDLYGREIEVQFVAKLRDELKFDSVELMTAQMHRDAADARRVLGSLSD